MPQVVGFVNVELTKLQAYNPPKELQDFLDAGSCVDAGLCVST